MNPDLPTTAADIPAAAAAPPLDSARPVPPYVALAAKIMANSDLAIDPATMAELSRLLPETDGVPLDSTWHRLAMTLLCDVLSYLYRLRNDVFIGANLFVYFSVNRIIHEEPDFFFVSGVEPKPPRRIWAIWDEGGKYPEMIVELLSPSTAVNDRTRKKEIYERIWRTPEYFCYEPEARKLEGWRLYRDRYRDIQANERGWMWCEQVQLWLGPWQGKYQETEGVWLRFYHPDGTLVPTAAEAEWQRAESERQRAEAAETELLRLKSLLAEKGQSPAGDP